MSGRHLYPRPKPSQDFKPPKSTPTPTIDQYKYEWSCPPAEARIRSAAAEESLKASFFPTPPLDWPSSSEDSENEISAVIRKVKAKRLKLKRKATGVVKLAIKTVHRTRSFNLRSAKREPAESSEEENLNFDDEYDVFTETTNLPRTEEIEKPNTFLGGLQTLQTELGRKLRLSSSWWKFTKKSEGEDEGRVEGKVENEEPDEDSRWDRKI